VPGIDRAALTFVTALLTNAQQLWAKVLFLLFVDLLLFSTLAPMKYGIAGKAVEALIGADRCDGWEVARAQWVELRLPFALQEVLPMKAMGGS
jgi:hypothetical protein